MRSERFPSVSADCWAREVTEIGTGVATGGKGQRVISGPEAGLLYQVMPVSAHEPSGTRASAWFRPRSFTVMGTSRKVAWKIHPGAGGKAKRRNVSRARLPVAALTASVCEVPKFVLVWSPFCT